MEVFIKEGLTYIFYVYVFVRLSVRMYIMWVQVPAAAIAGVTGRVLYGC